MCHFADRQRPKEEKIHSQKHGKKKINGNHQADKTNLKQTDQSSGKTEVDWSKWGEGVFCQGTTASICRSVHPPVQPLSLLGSCSFEQLPNGVTLTVKGRYAIW